MKNIDLIFDNNNRIINTKTKLDRGRLIVYISEKEINGSIIGRIIGIVNSIEKRYPRIKVPIIFHFGKTRFRDKLTYVILECIFYYLIEEKKHDVMIYLEPQVEIDVEGVLSSPLFLLNNPKKEIRRKFALKFNHDIYMKHFRKLVYKDDIGILDEINYFLKVFKIDEDSREDISEVFAELISNGTEHGEGECLVDIDVTDGYNKVGENNPDKKYYGINITVLNFSKNLLNTTIKDKIIDSSLTTDRYQLVKDAYSFHKGWFSEEYREEDFFNITVFQDKISGRPDDELTGGTGLTLLIKSLEQRSDMNLCYVLSGSRALAFEQDYMEYNADRWIGFNDVNDYLHCIPKCNRVISGCDIFFPGTAYNLHFIMEKRI